MSELSGELYKLVQDWASKTDSSLKLNFPKKRIGESGGLLSSIRSQTGQMGDNIQYVLSFRNYGRYVDMGVGNGVSLEGRATNAGIAKKRKRKQWYSRTWHGRLHLLTGMVAVEMSETVLKEIKKQIENE